MIDKIADELFKMTIIDLLDRIHSATIDSERPPVDLAALRTLYDKIEETVIEAAEYEI